MKQKVAPYRPDSLYLSSLCMELSLILKAGIPVSEGLSMLAEGQGGHAETLLKALAGSTDIGNTLYFSLEESGAFPAYMINMVRLGEETGRLESVLASLSSYYDRMHKLGSSIRSSIFYPAVLFVLMLIVVGVLMTQVLPVFSDVSEQLGIETSAVASVLTRIGMFLSDNALFILIGIVVLIAAAAFLIFKFFAKTKLGQTIATARFAFAAAMSISGGLDLDSVLRLAGNLTGNPYVKSKVETCEKLIGEGESFENAVNKSELFSPIYSRMLTVGQRTGSTDIVMDEIARRYEEFVNDDIEQKIGRLEPILIIVLSLLVGLILLSVMLPLMNIMTAIG